MGQYDNILQNMGLEELNLLSKEVNEMKRERRKEQKEEQFKDMMKKVSIGDTIVFKDGDTEYKGEVDKMSKTGVVVSGDFGKNNKGKQVNRKTVGYQRIESIE